MPYKKTAPRRKKSYTRKAKTLTWSDIASQAGKIALKSLLGLNTQISWFDTVETNVSTSSTMQTMANPQIIPIGDTSNSRSGSQIRVTDYRVKGRIQANTAAVTATFVRVVFVKFKGIRGTTPGASAFLDSNTRITSQYNMGDGTASCQYSVLYDRTFQISVPGNDGDIAHFEFDWKPKRFLLRWDTADTLGTASNLIDGYVRGFIMTSETGANTPNYWADHRIKFVDN